MKNILQNIKINKYNYYEIKLFAQMIKYKNFRGSILEIEYRVPEFYKMNKLKKSKKKKTNLICKI